jgi:hypothetical protein
MIGAERVLLILPAAGSAAYRGFGCVSEKGGAQGTLSPFSISF